MSVIQNDEVGEFLSKEIDKSAKFINDCNGDSRLFSESVYLYGLFFLQDNICDKEMDFSDVIDNKKNYEKILKCIYNSLFTNKFISEQNFHRKYLGEIFNTVSVALPYLYDYDDVIFTKGDFKSIIYDFLKSIGQDNKFNKLISSEKLDIIKFDQSINVGGVTLYNPVDNKYLMGIEQFDYSLYNLLVLVHECGHISDFIQASDSMTPKELENYLLNSPYREVNSLLYEKMFFKYLVESKICMEDITNLFYDKQFRFNDHLLSTFLYSYLDSKYLIDDKYKFLSSDELCSELSKKLIMNDSTKEFVSSYDFSLFDDCCYSYGNIISSFLHDNILEEGRMDSSLMKKFMNIRSGNFDRRFIEDNNLSVDKFSKVYTKELKRAPFQY